MNITIKRIIIFGNGRLHTVFLRGIHTGDYIIGVDRAAYWLIAHKILPDLAIGDFDSVTKQEFRIIKKTVKNILQFSKDKDSTDMELAVKQAIRLKPTEVIIVGGTGTRLDHTMATWHLLEELLRAHIHHILEDQHNRIRIVGTGKTNIDKASYRYISILPYTKSTILSLVGFRYNLHRTRVLQGTTIGLSNEVKGKTGTITVYEGKVWVVESRD